LNYKYLPTKDLKLKTSTIQAYNFGLQESTFQKSILNMQYVGAEIIYDYQFPIFSIGLGFQVDYNISRYGELVEKRSLFPWERSSDGEKVSTSSSKGVLASQTQNKVILSPELLVNFNIGRRAGLYLGAKYQLNDYLPSSEVDGVAPQWIAAPLQMKIGISYDFIQWKGFKKNAVCDVCNFYFQL